MSPGLFKQDTEERAPSSARPTPRSVDRAGRRDSSDSSLSVLGPGLEIVGDVKARGTVQLEGRVEGTLQVDGQLTVSSRGSVEGEVTADEIVVGGRVEGTLLARKVARLREGCRVRADVRSPRLELAEGGLLQGRVEMKDAREAEGRMPPPSARPASVPTRPEAGSGPKGQGGTKDEAGTKGESGPKGEGGTKETDAERASDAA